MAFLPKIQSEPDSLGALQERQKQLTVATRTCQTTDGALHTRWCNLRDRLRAEVVRLGALLQAEVGQEGVGAAIRQGEADATRDLESFGPDRFIDPLARSEERELERVRRDQRIREGLVVAALGIVAAAIYAAVR